MNNNVNTNGCILIFVNYGVILTTCINMRESLIKFPHLFWKLVV